jgi:hypothetical protein
MPAGASLTLEDGRGATPLHAALERGHRALARAILTALAERAEAAEVTLMLKHLDGIARAELGLESDAPSTFVGDGHPEVSLPAEFAAQADLMPLYQRKLLVDAVPPGCASGSALLRALCLDAGTEQAARVSMAKARSELLLQKKRLLCPEACAALRRAVDASEDSSFSTREDSVDGLPEQQLDLSLEAAVSLIGQAGIDALRTLPRCFEESSRDGAVWQERGRRAACGSEGNGRGAFDQDFVISRMFVRRYTPTERPWFRFHTDTAALTANVALASDALHRGGRLLALVGGEMLEIERDEGEVTCHPSTLMHGVTRMRSGTRYSLICFYRNLRQDVDGLAWL